MKKILVGLAFPNAIMFGFALIFFGCFGLYQTFLGQEYEINAKLLIKAIFLIVPILLGLIPVISTKYIEIDNEHIYSYNCLYFFIKVSREYKMDEYNGVFIRKGNKIYNIESGLKATAKSEYSLKLYDILLRDKQGNYTILIKNIGNKKRAKIVLNEIISRVDYQY